jgi:predicted MPP superfamily phosphohydrolase
MNEPDALKVRFSDHLGFWLAATLMITAAHIYLYMAVGRYLSRPWEAAWVAIGVASLGSSFAVSRSRDGGIDRKNILPRLLLQRLGACWNIFVLLTAAIMLVLRMTLKFHPLTPWAAYAASCLASCAICVYGMIEARILRLVTLNIETKKLPRGEHMRIVQLSDIHIGPFMDMSFVRKLTDGVKKLNPDLVLVTGDIVDGLVGDGEGVFPYYAAFADCLRELSGASRLGVWAIPGNHDYYGGFDNSRDFMERAGIKLLLNEKTDVGGILLLGADDRDHEIPSDMPFMSRSEKLVDSLTDGELEKFVILLRHRPIVEAITIGSFDIQLSGHTHGGQLFSLPSSRHRIPGRPKGLLSLGRGSYLYVTNGAGFVGPPMRFFAPAEIVSIDLEGE